MKHAFQSALPRRSGGKTAPVAMSGPPVAPTASTEQQLAAALARIDALEERLARIESALTVDNGGNVHLSTEGQLVLYGGQGASLASGIHVEVECVGGASIDVGANLELSGGTMKPSFAMLDASVPTAKFAGTIQCDTIIARNVMGSSYTPGAGNIW
jgi:hypothetical protein